MTTKTLFGLLCGALFVLSTGCADQESAASSGDTDLSATEANLIASDSSLAGSQEQAQACFDEMKACKDSGGDKAACLEQLQTCLPAEPAAPKECGPKGPPGKGKKGPPPLPPEGAGGAPAGPSPGAPDCDKPPPPEGVAGEPPQGEGAMPPPGAPPQGGDAGAPPEGMPGKKGPKGPPPGACAPPGVPHEELKGCHEKLGAALEQDGDEDAAMSEHKDCMKKAFGKHKKPLCEKGESGCAASDAPADTCANIQQCCSDKS